MRITGDYVSVRNCEIAIETFKTISGWKDSDEQIDICNKMIEEIKRKEEESKIRKKDAAVVVIVAVVIAIVCIIVFNVIRIFMLHS